MSVKLTKLCGEDLRLFILKKQWEGYCRGPEVIHNKPYPIMSETIAKRDLDMYDNTVNPELRAI